MYTILIVFQVLLAAALIAVVLVQRGPGATMGAAFGSGASGTVFGSRGATGFLTKLTSWLGVAFFGASLAMAVLAARSADVGEQVQDLGVAEQLVPPAAEQPADAAPASADEAQAPESEASEPEFLEVPVEEDATGEESPEPPAVD